MGILSDILEQNKERFGQMRYELPLLQIIGSNAGTFTRPTYVSCHLCESRFIDDAALTEHVCTVHANQHVYIKANGRIIHGASYLEKSLTDLQIGLISDIPITVNIHINGRSEKELVIDKSKSPYSYPVDGLTGRVLIKIRSSRIDKDFLLYCGKIAVRSEAIKAKEQQNESGRKEGGEARYSRNSEGDKGGLGQAVRGGKGQDNLAGQAGQKDEIRKLTPADLNSLSFNRWFGDSRATDQNTGKPLIFWHGSETFGQPSGSYTFGENRGLPKSPISALGHIFTEDASEAAGYTGGTGNKYAVALRLENPLIINAWELPIFTSPYEAQEYANDVKAAGHDGIHVTSHSFFTSENFSGGCNLMMP